VRQRVTVITLGVSDLARARTFYEGVGWRSDSPPEIEVVFFQAGGLVVSLWTVTGCRGQRRRAGEGYGGVTLAYNVGSPAEVDEVIAEARAAGATIGREPGETFWVATPGCS